MRGHNLDEVTSTHHCYRLNDLIEFCPFNKTLRSLVNAEAHTTLTAPAALCLKLLLEKHSEVVLQKEFNPYVWGKEGERTTTNTLYQNISLVRRGLSYIENDFGNVVQTIPRQGFKLDDALKVELIPGLELHTQLAVKNVINSQKNASLPLNFFFLKKTVLVSSTFVALAMIYLFFITKGSWGDKNFFDHYLFLSKSGKCNFYINSDAHDSIRHNEIIQSQSFNCLKYPYIYLTAYHGINSATFTACQRSLTKYGDANCATTYIREIK